MRQSLRDSKSLAVLLGLILLLLLGAFYYYVIYPKSEAKKQAIQSIGQLQTEIMTLEQQVAVLSVVDTEKPDAFELHKKLPEQRELDNLLRSIHEVEAVSESKILKVSFNNYDEEVAQSDSLKSKEETETAPAATTEEPAVETPGTESANEEKPVTTLDIEALPTEVKYMTLELDMQVLDESHLLTFLKEIEGIERIVRIDRVEIKGAPDEFELAQKKPTKQILVKVQLTTFYAEGVNS